MRFFRDGAVRHNFPDIVLDQFRCLKSDNAGCVGPRMSMKDPAAAPLDEPGMAAGFVVGLRKGSFTDLEAANRLVNATLLRRKLRRGPR